MNFWEYQPKRVYFDKQRQRFEQQARAAAFNQIAGNILKTRGLDPATRLNRLPNIMEPPPIRNSDIQDIAPDFDKEEAAQYPAFVEKHLTSKPKKKKGILGTLEGIVNEGTEAVGLNDIEQPWDVLRPAKRLMDWEQREIASPLAKRILEPLPHELEHNGLLVFAAETALSPSTWVGPGLLTKGVKVGAKAVPKAAGAVPALAQVFRGASSRVGRETFEKAVKGASDENAAITKMAEGLKSMGYDQFAAKNIDEMMDYHRSHRSFLSGPRGKLDAFMPPTVKSFIEDFIGIDISTSDVVPYITQYERSLGMGMNYGNAAANTVEGAIKKAFDTDRTRTYIMDDDLFQQAVAANIPSVADHGALTIDTLVRNVELFNLSDQQKAAISFAAGPMDTVKGMLKASGNPRINADEIDTFHREIFQRPETITRRDPTDLGAAGTQKRNRMSGQVVKGTIGGREAIANPDTTYRTMEEGLQAGIKYMPFAEAQAAGVAQAFKMISDDWLTRAIQPYGVSVADLLPPKLVKEKNQLDQYLNYGMTLRQKVTAAIGNPSLNRSWNLKKRTYDRLDPELQRIADDAALASTLPKMADRKAMFEATARKLDATFAPKKLRRAEVSAELGQHKRRLATEGAQPTYMKDADGKIMLDEAGKPIITRESLPVNVRGRFYGREAGDDLNALFSPRTPLGIEKGITALNNFARPLMATLDVSFLGIQGLMGLATNPKAYGVALKNVISRGYDDYFEKQLGPGHIDSFLKAGGYWAARNDFGEFVFPHVYKKVPGLGRLTDASNMAFTEFGNILRMEMWKAGASKAKNLEDFAQLVNKATGYTPGNPTSLESISMFAPRFFRAQLGILSDAVTKRDFSSTGAANMLAKLTTIGSAFTILANQTILDADYDYLSPLIDRGEGFEVNNDFMTMKIGSHKFSVFGPWDSLAKLAFRAAAEGPDDAGVYFLRSKASPVVARIWDTLEGESFTGDPTSDFSSVDGMLNSLLNQSKTVLPISVQNVIQNGVPTSAEDIGATALEFTGIKISERSKYELLLQERDAAAQRFANVDWDDLEPHQRQDLVETFPELEGDGDLRKDTNSAWNNRNTIMERFTQRQESIDQRLTGLKWREAYQQLQLQKAAVLEQWEEDNPKEAAKLRSKKNKTPEEEALQSYYDLFSKANDETWTKEELGDALDDFEGALSPSQLSYIERNTGLKGTDKVQEYRADQKILKPYWEAEDQVWDKLKQRGRVQEATLGEYITNKERQLLSQGVQPEAIQFMLNRDPIIKAMQGAVGDVKMRLRARNPEMEKVLLKWGYVTTPIRFQQRTASSSLVQSGTNARL